MTEDYEEMRILMKEFQETADEEKKNSRLYKKCAPLCGTNQKMSLWCKRACSTVQQIQQTADQAEYDDFVATTHQHLDKQHHALYKKCMDQLMNDKQLTANCKKLLYLNRMTDNKPLTILQNELMANYALSTTKSNAKIISLLYLMARHDKDCFVLGNYKQDPYHRVIIHDILNHPQSEQFRLRVEHYIVVGPPDLVRQTYDLLKDKLEGTAGVSHTEGVMQWIVVKSNYFGVLKKNFQKCVNSNARFTGMYLGLTLDTFQFYITSVVDDVATLYDGFISTFHGGHANMIIVDKHEKTIERYDPMGSVEGAEILNKQLDLTIQGMIMFPSLKNYTYVGVMQICPLIPGFQAIENELDRALIEAGGWCVTWSLFYLDLRLSYRHKSRDEVLKMAFNKMKTGNALKSFIVNYSVFQVFIRNQIEKVIVKTEMALENSTKSPKEKIFIIMHQIEMAIKNFALIYGAGARLSRKRGWTASFDDEITAMLKDANVDDVEIGTGLKLILKETFLTFETIALDFDLDSMPQFTKDFDLKSIKKKPSPMPPKKPSPMPQFTKDFDLKSIKKPQTSVKKPPMPPFTQDVVKSRNKPARKKGRNVRRTRKPSGDSLPREILLNYFNGKSKKKFKSFQDLLNSIDNFKIIHRSKLLKQINQKKLENVVKYIQKKDSKFRMYE